MKRETELMTTGDWVAMAVFAVVAIAAPLVALNTGDSVEAKEFNAAMAALGVADIECPRGISERLALREMAQTGQKPTACVVIMK